MKSLDHQICSEAWTSNETIKNHRELCLTYRGRFSASDDALGAANFIRDKFQEYGIDNARLESFPMPAWTRGTARLEIIEPHHAVYPCIALPYTGSCSVELELADAGMGHPEHLAEVPGTVAGKALLVDDRNPPAGPGLHRLHKYVHALSHDAAAFLFVQNAPGMLCPTGSLAFNHNEGLDQAIPAVGIPNEIAAELREWASKGKVRIRLTMENDLVRGEDYNIVADLSGPNSSDDMIIVGGHYDGHDIAHGAVDNASGTVAVLEAARLLAPLRDHLNCTVRFVLFGSEEMGLVGSYQMAEQMKDAMDKIRFVFNLDCVGSPGRLVMMMQNCPELLDFFTEQVESFPADIQVADHFVPFSDHFPFIKHGVPAAMMVTPGSGGRGWGHTLADTFEKVSQETLMKVGMHTARLVLRTAMATDWPAEPKDRGKIAKMLEDLHMRVLLEHEGHWDF